MRSAMRLSKWAGALVVGAGIGFCGSSAHAQAPSTAPAAPTSGWTGYAPATAWTGIPRTTANTAWVYYNPPRSSSYTFTNRPSQYREFGTGRPVALAKPWLPGAHPVVGR